MKRLFITLIAFFFLVPAFAAHLKGGFFTYKYLGTSGGKLQYSVRLTVYMICDPNSGQLTTSIPITIFNAATNTIVQNPTASLSSSFKLSRAFDDPCLSNEKLGCYYTIAIYDIPLIELDQNVSGYTLAYQRCCRIIDISNIQAPSDSYGNTYSITIPGTNKGPDAPKNSSANFLVNDTAVICQNSFFELPFVANDPDGDSLSYSFCDAWVGGGQGAGSGPNSPAPDPAAAPPYGTVPYSTGFSGGQPLGSVVTIDPTTGMISGIAPAIGEYVVTVCVNEYKNHVLVAQTRKELHVLVGDCGAVRASLKPEYVNCKDFQVLFSNATNSGVTDYFWDFGVTSATNDTSNLATPTFNYPDTGKYKLKLIVNRFGNCKDTAESLVKVYPGFFPNFGYAGVCATKPTQFHDSTKTVYGVVNSWSWNFGDNTTLTDTSHQQHPQYSYPASNTYTVNFIVTSNKGCIDTLKKQVVIMDKPPLDFPFRDTLICNGDTLQLHGIGNGNYSWTPNTNMLNSNSPDPLVFPTVTTIYTARLDDQGCINQDTVRVRVVDVVSLQARGDTAICLTDSVLLTANTNGLRFEWTPAADFSNPTTKDAYATPHAASTTYQIRAHIGHCSTTDNVIVQTSPYPKADAGPDTVICFRTVTQLHGVIQGTDFTWSPTSTLKNANTLNPIAFPINTTRYVLSAFDASGFCPKPKTDTVVVTVFPRIEAFAGRDTSVVVGQPLQFTASGGTGYNWIPATGLNNPSIFNPIGNYNGSFDSIRYTVIVTNAAGCIDSASVNVRIFTTVPKIFVPTAFTPNGDGKNDIVRPIAAGIKKIEYFRIYNRWGQLVFSTTVDGAGWDGNIRTKDQGTNVFVWIVKAIDYTGKPYFDKGTVTLIR